MQKRAARVKTGSNFEIRARQIFESLGWAPIANILKKRETTRAIKAKQDKLPGYCQKCLSLTIVIYISQGVMTVDFT